MSFTQYTGSFSVIAGSTVKYYATTTAEGYYYENGSEDSAASDVIDSDDMELLLTATINELTITSCSISIAYYSNEETTEDCDILSSSVETLYPKVTYTLSGTYTNGETFSITETDGDTNVKLYYQITESDYITVDPSNGYVTAGTETNYEEKESAEVTVTLNYDGVDISSGNTVSAVVNREATANIYTVTITCETEGATIYYKLSETDGYIEYLSELTLTEGITVYYYASCNGYENSEEESYTVVDDKKITIEALTASEASLSSVGYGSEDASFTYYYDEDITSNFISVSYESVYPVVTWSVVETYTYNSTSKEDYTETYNFTYNGHDNTTTCTKDGEEVSSNYNFTLTFSRGFSESYISLGSSTGVVTYGTGILTETYQDTITVEVICVDISGTKTKEATISAEPLNSTVIITADSYPDNLTVTLLFTEGQARIFTEEPAEVGNGASISITSATTLTCYLDVEEATSTGYNLSIDGSAEGYTVTINTSPILLIAGDDSTICLSVVSNRTITSYDTPAVSLSYTHVNYPSTSILDAYDDAYLVPTLTVSIKYYYSDDTDEIYKYCLVGSGETSFTKVIYDGDGNEVDSLPSDTWGISSQTTPSSSLWSVSNSYFAIDTYGRVRIGTSVTIGDESDIKTATAYGGVYLRGTGTTGNCTVYRYNAGTVTISSTKTSGSSTSVSSSGLTDTDTITVTNSGVSGAYLYITLTQESTANATAAGSCKITTTSTDYDWKLSMSVGSINSTLTNYLRTNSISGNGSFTFDIVLTVGSAYTNYTTTWTLTFEVYGSDSSSPDVSAAQTITYTYQYN